jgi:hypothetical protein
MTFGVLVLNLRVLQSYSKVSTVVGALVPYFFIFFAFLGVILPELSIVIVAEQIICWMPPILL